MWEERKAGGRNGSFEGQPREDRPAVWMGEGVHVESSQLSTAGPLPDSQDRTRARSHGSRSGVGCFRRKDGSGPGGRGAGSEKSCLATMRPPCTRPESTGHNSPTPLVPSNLTMASLPAMGGLGREELKGDSGDQERGI